MTESKKRKSSAAESIDSQDKKRTKSDPENLTQGAADQGSFSRSNFFSSRPDPEEGSIKMDNGDFDTESDQQIIDDERESAYEGNGSGSDDSMCNEYDSMYWLVKATEFAKSSDKESDQQISDEENGTDNNSEVDSYDLDAAASLDKNSKEDTQLPKDNSDPISEEQLVSTALSLLQTGFSLRK